MIKLVKALLILSQLSADPVDPLLLAARLQMIGHLLGPASAQVTGTLWIIIGFVVIDCLLFRGS